MTTHTRTARARRDRTQTLTTLTARLDRIAAGSTARLTRAEAALLAETIRALQADAHHLAQDRRGLARARSADIEKRIAAEAAIVEVEQERDTGLAAIKRIRAYATHLFENGNTRNAQLGLHFLTLVTNLPEHVLIDDRGQLLDSFA